LVGVFREGRGGSDLGRNPGSMKLAYQIEEEGDREERDKADEVGILFFPSMVKI